MMPQLATPMTLNKVFSEVLANLAFMFVAEPGDEELPARRRFEVSIDYSGSISGRLIMRCPEEFGLLLAANLLGLDPQEEPAGVHAEDALKELMNVLCGQLITALHGCENTFHLSIPQIRELMGEAAAAPLEEAEVSRVYVEGYAVELAYTPA